MSTARRLARSLPSTAATSAARQMSQYLFTPKEVRVRAERAVKAYLSQIDKTGRAARAATIDQLNERALLGALAEAERRPRAEFDNDLRRG